MKRIQTTVLAAVACAGVSISAYGALSPVTFETDVDAKGRKASATFENVTGGVKVTLANLAGKPTGSWDDTYALSGLFFDYAHTITTPTSGPLGSARVGAGGGTIGDFAEGSSIGDYWAYNNKYTSGSSYSPPPGGATKGLQAVGFSLGGASSGNLGSKPQQIAGLNGSILGWSDAEGGNKSVKEPLVWDSIEFILNGTGWADLTASDFSKVSFQYGSAIVGNNIAGVSVTSGPPPHDVTPVPEASTYVAGALMLLPLGVSMMRKLRANRAA